MLYKHNLISIITCLVPRLSRLESELPDSLFLSDHHLTSKTAAKANAIPAIKAIVTTKPISLCPSSSSSQKMYM